jgi:hypothetical protein
MIRTGKLLQRQSVLQLVRPKLEQKNEVADITEAIEGREDRKLFAPEYISPERQAPHSLWKRIVRQDCLRRRNVIEIPEFYVGSLLRYSFFLFVLFYDSKSDLHGQIRAGQKHYLCRTSYLSPRIWNESQSASPKFCKRNYGQFKGIKVLATENKNILDRSLLTDNSKN